MLKITKLLVFLLVLTVMGSAYAEARIKKSRNGTIIKWHKADINICLDKSAESVSDIDDALLSGINAWNASLVSPKLVIATTNCEVSVIYSMLTGWAEPVPLATTTIDYTVSTGEVTSGIVIINSHYANKVGDITKSNHEYDIHSIITHELGHVLGLDEDYDDKYSSMYILTEKYSKHKRNLNISDISAIFKIYYRE